MAESKFTEAVLVSAVTLLISGASLAFGYGVLNARVAEAESASDRVNHRIDSEIIKRLDLTDTKADLHLRDEAREQESIRKSLEAMNLKLAAICASLKKCQ